MIEALLSFRMPFHAVGAWLSRSNWGYQQLVLRTLVECFKLFNYSTAFKNPEIGNIETSICHTEIMWRNECQESKKQSADGSESCSLRQLHLLRSHILQLSSAKAFYSSWMVHFWSFLNSICMCMIFILSNIINIKYMYTIVNDSSPSCLRLVLSYNII